MLVKLLKWYLNFYIHEKANEILDYLIIEARKPNSAITPNVKSILRQLRFLKERNVNCSKMKKILNTLHKLNGLKNNGKSC